MKTEQEIREDLKIREAWQENYRKATLVNEETKSYAVWNTIMIDALRWVLE